jgi:hypothetical protein
LSPCLMLHELPLGRINCSDGVDRTLA